MTEAFVTLITNDSYAKGALVLGQSLKASGTTRNLALLCGYNVQEPWKSCLEKTFDEIIDVTILDSGDVTRLALMKRPELGVTFTKLQCWTLTQYTKCVFMDADTLVVENIDSLFERDEISAAPDVGWPDMFNTGVFVLKPSMETYNALLKLAEAEGSFDGGDQGLLNSYFKDWSLGPSARRLPFVYNMAANLTYTYLPALLRFGTDVKVVHFLGQSKPWNFGYSEENDCVYGGNLSDEMYQTTKPFIRSWWKLYYHKVSPLFTVTSQGTTETKNAAPTPPVAGSNGPVHTSNGTGKAPESIKPASPGMWDRGEVNYTGDDRFIHIQNHLDSIIKGTGY